MLSDRDIASAMNTGDVVIKDADRLRLQASSLDVCLDSELLHVNTNGVAAVIDPKLPSDTTPYRIGDEGFLLQPQEFILGCTVETVALSNRIVARVEGKSSLGRLGLLVHCTAGFVDAGFSGQVTLELYNVSGKPLVLYAGMPIAQLAFDWLHTPAETPYAGKYQGQQGPVASRYFMNWDQERGTW